MPRLNSSAEREIRDAVVARLRVELPNARIVHELVCGDCRADLAVIEPHWLTLVELKSEKDTLDRCEKQMTNFAATGHDAILVAHTKWFDHKPYNDGSLRCVWPDHRYKVWHFPEPEKDHPAPSFYQWKLPDRLGYGRSGLRQPAPRRLLGLLWREELCIEANAHGVTGTKSMNMEAIIDMMAYHMTGKEIALATCRRLRARPFPEADAPIEAPDALMLLARAKELQP